MATAARVPVPPGGPGQFCECVRRRLDQLASEFGQTSFLMPLGLFLVIDTDNGGDATAAELTRRFKLLDFESKNIVDFYFLGWRESYFSEGMQFDLAVFESYRDALRRIGVYKFGGNADLILVDARYSGGDVTLNFEEAVRVDLSASDAEKDFPTLGAFLQSIIDAAEEVRKAGTSGETHGFVFSISDRLGLATAKKSILDFVLEKWGKVIGGKKLTTLAVRNLGPEIDLNRIR
jgi:hypothetical protein